MGLLMSKLVVVLADLNEKYLMPLELKFIEEFKDKVDIIVITDKDYFRTYFSTLQRVDILIINEDLYTADLNRHYITNLFILTEQNTLSSTEDMSLYRIYKYTSVKEVFNEVMGKTSAKSLRTINEKGTTKVLMVYSPGGGIGKTTSALGVCAAMAKQHKRVLYLNTETLQSFNHMLQNKGFCPGGFERHMTGRSEGILQYLQGCVGFELFDYLLPFRQSASSLNISMDDYKYLIDSIKSSHKYDYIVVDTSSDFTSDKTKMMGYCDKIMIITGQDAVSVAKLDCLLNNIDCSDNNKFVFVCNKYSREQVNYLLNKEIVTKCQISEHIEWMEFDYSSFSLEVLSSNKHFQRLAYMLI